MFSHQTVFNSSQPHGLEHSRLPCPSPSPKLMSIESVMPSNHLILCCPLLLLTAIFPIIRVFSNESAVCIMWLKYRSFSISPSSEYSGLISFRIVWFDLLTVQGTLKSLQHHSRCHCRMAACPPPLHPEHGPLGGAPPWSPCPATAPGPLGRPVSVTPSYSSLLLKDSDHPPSTDSESSADLWPA